MSRIAKYTQHREQKAPNLYVPPMILLLSSYPINFSRLLISSPQGTSVADTFLHLPGWRVRGITRDPTKVQAQELTARGVEIVVADLNDVKSLIPAFTGATAIFAVTDFWAPMFSPETNSHLKPSQTLNEYCYDLELQQGRNIANAAAAESTMKTLKRFVYSSLSDAKRWSGGKYTWVYHFDAKAKVVEYVRQEQTELSERMSTVQIGEYADNWAKFPMLAPQKVKSMVSMVLYLYADWVSNRTAVLC